MNKVRSLLVLAVSLLLAAAALGQSDLGTISGIFRDQSGATVPNAKITIKNEGTGAERTLTTNDSGYFVTASVPPGFYKITAEAAGFKKYETKTNKLDASGALSLDAVLTVGSATETVEVTATAQALQTESSAVQKLVTREQIDALELNGRNPIFMANLVPGTRGGNLAGLSFAFSQGPSNINGARTSDSAIMYDGAPAVRTRSNGTSLGSADVDSTQEIQILTNSFAAEYGRSSGGQIRIISKTGTTQFHGAAYDYVRNAAFNANTWTRNHQIGPDFLAFQKVPHNVYNQFGYNIGGPAWIPGKFNDSKTKFFWYWGQEWVKYRFLDTNSQTVPSLLMRQGNFSELLDPNNIYTSRTINGAKVPVVLYEPGTCANPAAPTSSCIPIPGNIIPTSRLSPNGIGIMRAYPTPNLTSPINANQFWYAALVHPQDQRKDTLSADINLSDKQRLQFRRMNFSFKEYQPLDGGTPFTPKYFDRPNQTNSLNYVSTISATKVNELLITASLDDVYIPVDAAHFLDRTTVGINYPYIFPQGKLVQNRIPTVNISNFSGLNGGPYPSHSAGPIYTLADSFTWIKSNHTFKFGFSFEHSGENDNDEINVSACPTCTNNQNGQFSFTDARSGQPSSGVGLANVALGLFDTYSELGARAYTPFRHNVFEGFAQDSWKVTRKLHLDYGIRYTVVVPYSATWRNMAVFDRSLYDPSKAVGIDPKTGAVILTAGSDRYNGLVIPGTGFPDSAKGRFSEATDPSLAYLFRGGNTPSYYSTIHYNQFAPRLGMAYQATDKTVVRLGIGRYFVPLGVSDSIFLGGNPPFQPTANVSYGSVDRPGGNSSNVLPLTVTTQSKNFATPESWGWNATAERELPFKSVLTAAYVGRRGLHLQREANINQPSIATIVANPGVNIDALRPYKGYNSIRESDNVSRSMYNSFQLSWNKRLSRGFSGGFAYTLSKSMDFGSAQRDIIPNTYDASSMYGQSDFDVRHILIANYQYELPIFRDQSKLTGKLLGGWQISGISQFQTGTACGVASGNDYAGVGQDGSFNCGGQLWIKNGDPSIVHNIALNGGGKADPAYWFNTTDSSGASLFTQPGKNTFNNVAGSRNLLHQPGFQNWNLGLFKKFAIGEKMGFQFRAQAFNAFNHPNWGGANFNPTSAQFGQITGKTGDVRNMQFSLRFYF